MKTTKIVAACVAVLISTISTSTSTATATATAAVTPPYRLGDVNCDGMVTASDASEVLKFYTDLSSGLTPTMEDKYSEALADVDRDGKITASDATAILRYYCDESSGVEPQWPSFNFEVGHRYLPLVEVPTSNGTLNEPFLVVSHKGNLIWIYVQSWGQSLFYLEGGVSPLQAQSNDFARLE